MKPLRASRCRDDKSSGQNQGVKLAYEQVSRDAVFHGFAAVVVEKNYAEYASETMVRTDLLANVATGSASAHRQAIDQRDSEGNNPSYFYPELPPREIFVNSRSGDESASSNNKQVSSSVSTLNQLDKDSQHDGKARFFTFEGLTPVSTVEDSREDHHHGDNHVFLIGNDGISPPPGNNQEASEDREAPSTPVVPAAAAEPNIGPHVNCWSLEGEETPFDEDPVVASPTVQPQTSHPNSTGTREVSSAAAAAPVMEASTGKFWTESEPPVPSRLGTLSDVSADTATPKAAAAAAVVEFPVEPAVLAVTPESVQPTREEPVVAAAASDPAAVANEPAVVVVPPIPDAAIVVPPTPTTTSSPPPPTAVAAAVPAFTAQRNPSSLLDDDDDDDDGVIAKEDYIEVVVAPTDELIEDRRVLESLLRDAETTSSGGEGCDVDICKHVLNSSNDICNGFSSLLPR
jgi:hypothetical protein